MASYIIRRSLQLILIALGAATIVFLLLRLSGDPVAMMVGDQARPEEVEALRRALGFDAPLHVQYWRTLVGALRGDLGTSLLYGQPVGTLLAARLGPTMWLAVVSAVLALVPGVLAGVAAAVKRGTWVDTVISVLSLLGQSVPTFWLGVMLMMIFGVRLQWFPISGMGGVRHVVLPAVTLSGFAMARIARMTRASVIQVLNEDYVRVARAKGVPDGKLLFKHILRNASIPILTIGGITFAVLLGGAVVTETLFAWPGIGRLLVEAIGARDYPLVQATIFITALLTALIMFLVDLTYAVLDPRIRYD